MQVVLEGVFVLSPELAAAQSYSPLSTSGLVAVVNSSVVGINEGDCFVFVQQRIPLGDFIRVGLCVQNGLKQAGLGVPADGVSPCLSITGCPYGSVACQGGVDSRQQLGT